jgi:hypothetical protein
LLTALALLTIHSKQREWLEEVVRNRKWTKPPKITFFKNLQPKKVYCTVYLVILFYVFAVSITHLQRVLYSGFGTLLFILQFFVACPGTLYFVGKRVGALVKLHEDMRDWKLAKTFPGRVQLKLRDESIVPKVREGVKDKIRRLMTYPQEDPDWEEFEQKEAKKEERKKNNPIAKLKEKIKESKKKKEIMQMYG